MSKVEPNITFETRGDKKYYIIDNIYYYKVVGMHSSYYLKKSDYENISLKQNVCTLYKNTLLGLEKIKGYIKSMDSSDILFVAPTINSKFKMYNLEKI